jgi:hypothetical protein
MRILAAAMLLIAAMPASAQMVYKCVARDGHVTLTSEPCQASQKIAAVVHAPPERMSRERHEELRRRRRQDDANSTYLNRLAGHSPQSSNVRRGPTQSESRAARCQSAKARRDATRRQLGMKVSYELTRKLDEMVYDACK